MKGISAELLEVNTRDDIKRWWEVMDRTTGTVVSPENWQYNESTGCVEIANCEAFHEYTVAFLAYIIWDPVHMYNAVTNNWQNFEHQITFDVRQPRTHKFTMERLRKFIADHPYVNVIRYTTFFHQFTLIFDELKREKYVDWYGYSASVSPYILEQFERRWATNSARIHCGPGLLQQSVPIPSKEYKDFQAFQRREVAALAKEMVDITHELGKEAMMCPGRSLHRHRALHGGIQNHRSGCSRWLCGQRLHPAADLRHSGVKYTEGRFLPYFFPDTFHEGAIR